MWDDSFLLPFFLLIRVGLSCICEGNIWKLHSDCYMSWTDGSPLNRNPCQGDSRLVWNIWYILEHMQIQTIHLFIISEYAFLFWFRWRVCFWVSIIPAALLALGMLFCAESPHWLYKVWSFQYMLSHVLCFLLKKQNNLVISESKHMHVNFFSSSVLSSRSAFCVYA